MRRSIIALACCVALGFTATVPAGAQKLPKTWDGLEQVKAKKFDAVYLLPGADFSGYTKVILDPTEVAFEKNWQRDYNDDVVGLSRRITDDDVRKALTMVQTGFQDVFQAAYKKAGFQIVTTPGHDVMRVRTAVLNLTVTAPDKQGASTTRSFARDAGQATLVLEVRDSMSNALLGRAIDAREAGEGGAYSRNSLSNKADFKTLFSTWAKISVDGMEDLKTSGNPAT